MTRLSTLVDQHRGDGHAFPDERTKRELRRRTLKAVAIPGHQVAFGRREMRPASDRQLALSLVGPDDVVTPVDQGSLVSRSTGGTPRPGAVVVLRVPFPEPLRLVEPSDAVTRRMHAERDYAHLHENIARYGRIALSRRYPCLVDGTVLMDPAPIPPQDVAKLHQSPALHLFGAGREQRVYAVPPYTDVNTG
jgi:alpha-D-ribose 1-methylphosphonate 5-phosphate C-P lyase